MHLYETHIPVTDAKASETFYSEVVGLPFDYRDPTRDSVFLWVDEKQKGMIGLFELVSSSKMPDFAGDTSKLARYPATNLHLRIT